MGPALKTLTPEAPASQPGRLQPDLSPNQWAAVQRMLAAIPAGSSELTLADVHQQVYAERSYDAAVDALGKLMQAVNQAAEAANLNLRLERSGARKLGAQGRVRFVGQPPTEQPRLAALQRHPERYVPPLGHPQEPIALIATVNTNETDAVLQTFLPVGAVPKVITRERGTYLDLGTHGDYRCVLVRSQPGSGTPGGSLSALKDALEDWRPQVLMAVGCAFGAHPDSQAKGQVLVSQQLLPYEPGAQRQGNFVPRGDKVTASSSLLQRLHLLDAQHRRVGSSAWPTLKVGVVVSGEKLVDDARYKKALVQLADKVVGGEMEGSGLYTAVHDFRAQRCEWLLLKGISDWADGSKLAATPEQKAREDEEQRQASRHAALVARRLLDLQAPTDPPNRTDDEPEASDGCAPTAATARHDLLASLDELRYQPPLGARIALRKGDPMRRDNVSLSDEEAPGPTPSASDTAAAIDAQSHIEHWLRSADLPPLFALLGEYGTGKTTLCQHLTQDALADPARVGHRKVLYFDLRDASRLFRQAPTLQEVIAECSRIGYAHSATPAPTPDSVLRDHAEGALVIFDGLDEALVFMDAATGQNFTRTLLSLHRPGAKGRLLLSSRTEFFRTLREQVNHFSLENRDQLGSEHYEAFVLHPFNAAQIERYLQQAMPAGTDVPELIARLATVHNLPELMQRPYTLARLSEVMPRLDERLRRGEALQAVDLYRELARDWLERDRVKLQMHRVEDKLELARDLAAELWRRGSRQIEVRALEDWLGDWLADRPRIARRYAGLDVQVLEEDLRNATFLKRIDEPKTGDSRFRFAHTSVQEYFLAEHLTQAVQDDAPDRWDLPAPSREAWQFTGQLLGRLPDQGLPTLRRWASQAEATAVRQQLWRYSLLALQEALPAPEPQAFRLQGLDLQGLRIDARRQPALQSLAHVDWRGANLREVEFRGLNLMAGDFRGADLRGAVIQGCRMAQTRFDGCQTAGLVLRDCDLEGADFGANAHPGLQWLRCTPAALAPLGCKKAPDPGRTRMPATAAPSQVDGHSGGVQACDFSPDGRLILSASHDQTLKLWDAASGSCLRSLSGHSRSVTACAFSPDGRLILSASHDQTLKLWDASSGNCRRSLSGHSDSVTACAFSPDGSLILSASDDQTLKLWDASSGACLRSLCGHSDSVTACAFSPDGRLILSASEDDTLKLWDASSGSCLRSLSGHSRPVTACAFSPDGRLILSTCHDKTLKLWDASSGSCLRSLSGHSDSVTACAFSPDGRLILSASYDQTLKLWDASSGSCLRSLSGHSDGIRACAFSPDGRLILSASYDKSLKLWDASSGSCLRSLSGHSRSVTSCAFSSDGRLILSASEDKTLKLWDAASGQCLRTHRALPEGHATLDDSQGGRLLSASGDAWRVLGWPIVDADGRPDLLPLETFGDLVADAPT